MACRGDFPVGTLPTLPLLPVGVWETPAGGGAPPISVDGGGGAIITLRLYPPPPPRLTGTVVASHPFSPLPADG